LHRIDSWVTGVVEMVAGRLNMNSAEPGCVPRLSVKVWHMMADTSVLVADRMERLQTEKAGGHVLDGVG